MGTRIQKLRVKKGFTQEYLAQQLSVSRQAVGKWEKDVSTPDTSNLIALSRILECSVEYLAIGDKETPQKESHFPFPFIKLAVTLFGVGSCVYLYGFFSGSFEHMLMIPIGKIGVGTGIYYGDEPFDIALLVLSCAFLILSIVFLVLGRHKQKSTAK